ncbi:hypothetical protein [Roseobacter sp. HKCCA0434]|uniref:hypothetical protein n=1 Tax=Roseobacter sp. HKCCA0434 TaxID=3079297 RepID=UPI0029059339|nr:hypothetical protein [Roseobacter sp. HKCCA0434]
MTFVTKALAATTALTLAAVPLSAQVADSTMDVDLVEEAATPNNTGYYVDPADAMLFESVEGKVDLTDRITIYNVVDETVISERMSTGTSLTTFDDVELVGTEVRSLDGTRIGAVTVVETYDDGTSRVLSLDTANEAATVTLAADNTFMTDDGLVYALTDEELVEVMTVRN